MPEREALEQQRHIAELVRDACVRTLLESYENAAMSGLCHEGAFECAVGAMRELDLEALLRREGCS